MPHALHTPYKTTPDSQAHGYGSRYDGVTPGFVLDVVRMCSKGGWGDAVGDGLCRTGRGVKNTGRKIFHWAKCIILVGIMQGNYALYFNLWDNICGTTVNVKAWRRDRWRSRVFGSECRDRVPRRQDTVRCTVCRMYLGYPQFDPSVKPTHVRCWSVELFEVGVKKSNLKQTAVIYFINLPASESHELQSTQR